MNMIGAVVIGSKHGMTRMKIWADGTCTLDLEGGSWCILGEEGLLMVHVGGVRIKGWS